MRRDEKGREGTRRDEKGLGGALVELPEGDVSAAEVLVEEETEEAIEGVARVHAKLVEEVVDGARRAIGV